MTQAAMAAIGGKQKLAQLKYEQGESSPSGAYLAAIAAAGADVLYILTGQKAVTPAQPPLSDGDRILLDNFHAAPEQVQAGVKTTLGAFAPGAKRRKSA